MRKTAGGHCTQARVLIVDDDPDFRDAVADLLKGEGFDVMMASNGRQALELLSGGLRPLAILLDLMMPVMNGMTFRAEQLKNPALSKIPVAVLSASGSSAQSIARDFGAVDYIPKPMTGASVLAFIERCRVAAEPPPG